MRPRLGRAAMVFGVALAACVAAKAAEMKPVPEPAGYRMSDYHHSAVPATLDGQPALSVTEAHKLWREKAAQFIDVWPQPPKPAGLAPGTFWHQLPRRDIPGSIWLPETGYGILSAATLDYFKRGLKLASGGNHDKPLVFYCSHQCWMSWNAAKRAKALGYTRVRWYEGGTQDWQAAGYPLKEQAPFPRR